MSEENGGEVAEKTIPYTRFSEVVSERNSLRDQLAEVQKSAATYQEQASQADTLARTLADMQAEHAKAASLWDQERALLGAGLTSPEGQAVARSLYSLQPEDGRPALGDWLSGLTQDGAEVPAGLRAYLQPSATPAAPPAAPAAPKAPGSPAPPASPPGTGTGVTTDQIRAAKVRGQQTGDWSDFRALSQQHRAQQQSRA